MIDALDQAFADADRMVMNCKSAASSVANVVSASAGYNNRPLSLVMAREQLLHFRGFCWSAVRLVAQRIACQDVCVGRRPTRRRYKSIGERIEPLGNHPLLDVLADPNDFQTYWQLMFATIASLEITGRGVWWISKGTRQTADGLGTSIMHIPSPWIIGITPLQDQWTIRPTYSTEEFTIPGDEVLNLHYPDPDGTHPNDVISPLSKISEAVLTDQQIQTAQHAAFKNGIYPSVILTAGRLPGSHPGVPGERPTFTAEQREDLIAAIRSKYRGVTSAGEPLILDALIEKVEKFSQSVTEMDFIGSSKVTKSRILQGYGVSPILLGELENANRASSTVAEEIFVYNKVNPLIELLSGILTQWLAPMFAGPRERLVCWIEAAQPHDAENTLKQWDLGLRFGAATRNEYRRSVLNLQDMDGGDVPLEPVAFLPREEPDDDTTGDTTDDAPGKRGKVRRRKDDDDDDDDDVCPECGGEMIDGVCEDCGYEKATRGNNGHAPKRFTITSKYDAAQPRDEQGRFAIEGGAPSEDQINYPHLAHLMNGQRVESAGHSKEDAHTRANKLRDRGVYATVLHDPKAPRGADHMVMVPAEENQRIEHQH